MFRYHPTPQPPGSRPALGAPSKWRLLMFSFKRSLIALVGLLVVVGTIATLMPLVSRGQGGNPFNRDTRRSFYITQTVHNGSQALSACAAGYHMASLWEILDTSNLKYDTVLGLTQDDSGFGPPSQIVGWIRTGRFASPGGSPGAANCDAWTSVDDTELGTAAALNPDWTGDINPGKNIHPWTAFTNPCNNTDRVWCVQD